MKDKIEHIRWIMRANFRRGDDPRHTLLSCVVLGCLILTAPVRVVGQNQSDDSHLQTPLTTDDARHLLMRTGVGARPADIVALRGLSRQQAIESVIEGISTEPDIPMPEWVNQPLPAYHARPDMDDESRARFNNQRDAELAQLRQWWVLNLLQTSSPQTERLVLFWHDLFATNYHDLGKQSLAMARQNQTFRTLGFGSWEVLLKAMIRDAALLEFLDSGSNHKASPNENLARELMELFVLGEGNYDEVTVREAARSLTGHDTARFHNLRFQLKTWAQDRGDKQLFGQTGAFTGDDLVELLLTQEAAPRFLATRFWHAFVSDIPPATLWIDDQAVRFRNADFDIATLYRNVLQSDAFWHSDNRGSMIKSPIDIVAGTARTLDYPMHQWQRMPQWQAMIGMDLFAPPNVAGWKEGAAFVTPGHLLNRYKVVRQLTRTTASKNNPNASTMSMATSTTPKSQGKTPALDDPDLSVPLDQSGNTMMMQTDKDTRMMEKPSTTSVAIRMAAEDFQGPVRFKVSLMHQSDSLWQGEPRPFMGGRDTAMLGRFENQSDVTWETVNQEMPLTALEQATALRIHFLNDASDANGDRNLYVDGIQLGPRWLPAARGVQKSGCTPRLRANAGKLYCNGFVQIELIATDRQSLASPALEEVNPPVKASAIHVQWGKANKKNGKHTLEIVLDHVETPEKNFQHIRFRVEKKRDEPVMLLLDSFSCWPDCIDSWPACSRIDKNFIASKHIAMPWVATDDERWSPTYDHLCQFNSLNENEKVLVASLWAELPKLLALAKQTNRVKNKRERWLPIIEFLLEEYQHSTAKIADTAYAPFADSIDISPIHAPPEVDHQPLSGPVSDTKNVQSLMDALSAEQLLIHQLVLPQLQVGNVPAMPQSKGIQPEQYLKAVLEHPLFQLK